MNTPHAGMAVPHTASAPASMTNESLFYSQPNELVSNSRDLIVASDGKATKEAELARYSEENEVLRRTLSVSGIFDEGKNVVYVECLTGQVPFFRCINYAWHCCDCTGADCCRYGSSSCVMCVGISFRWHCEALSASLAQLSLAVTPARTQRYSSS
ncbi:hypothetical protein K431DRAFT_298532 [Polychaeton citri CBS 116435]|uniref:Uncharacterized protein n=1 Tax=Polychaeton citri CBS 116435 TaxID=1314669 RepID=A0A9P4UJN8_9PEZI|nr:hypothetical protein K431DRAFT_298532 [Polychaeton citri CBS 116435]